MKNTLLTVIFIKSLSSFYMILNGKFAVTTSILFVCFSAEAVMLFAILNSTECQPFSLVYSARYLCRKDERRNFPLMPCRTSSRARKSAAEYPS